MTCFRPLQAVRVDHLVSGNPIRIIDSTAALQLRSQAHPGLLQLPCGKCVGCKLAYSRSWAVRCTHESQTHEYNSFITLTYNDYYNDRNGRSLTYRDFQLFIKRLRKALDESYSDYAFLSDSDSNLRFYMCGEYGSKTFRPHFHALFFNLEFSDQKLHSVRNGFKFYTSETLASFWTDPVTGDSLGHSGVGSVSIESAGYVSRYCVKKALGDPVVYFDHDTGEFLHPEFTQMSRKPGIAFEWFKKYSKSVYPEDKVVMHKGLICKPPRYYDSQLEKVDPALFEAIKLSRLDYASSPSVAANSSVERLIVREKLQLSRMSLLPRAL